ncbi:Peptidyl-prolyl cis-trans isomerase ppiD [Novosphingobium sp. 9U]|nr:Peptidyl-prolyl cis-trans isomerase ppiD [Novosphingobium sp. 9U]
MDRDPRWQGGVEAVPRHLPGLWRRADPADPPDDDERTGTPRGFLTRAFPVWTGAPYPLYGAPHPPAAGLAQLVEHLICNQGATGSNPVAGTMDLASTAASIGMAFRMSRTGASSVSWRRDVAFALSTSPGQCSAYAPPLQVSPPEKRSPLSG